MSWIDLAIASLVVIAGLRGWSLGLFRQLGSFLGRVGGLVGGCYLAVVVEPHIPSATWRPLDVILIIGVSTVAGGLILRFFGGVFSARLHEHRLGLLDSGLGAAVGAVGMLVTCWFIAALLAVVPWSSVGQSINHSVILRYTQRVLPPPPAIESRLQGVLSQVNVPSLFAGVVAPTLPAATTGTLLTRHHQGAPSGVELVYASGGCGVDSVGTGFVAAPGEVVTAAHLVAGRHDVTVGGQLARVVFFDARSDVAVLHVAIAGDPLGLSKGGSGRSAAVVVGFATLSDRVRSAAVLLGQVHAPGRDIYSGPVFMRSLDVVVTPLSDDESGSPVLVNGQVVAMVLERAVNDSNFVYAVAATQIRADLSHPMGPTVSTQRCVS